MPSCSVIKAIRSIKSLKYCRFAVMLCLDGLSSGKHQDSMGSSINRAVGERRSWMRMTTSDCRNWLPNSPIKFGPCRPAFKKRPARRSARGDSSPGVEKKMTSASSGFGTHSRRGVTKRIFAILRAFSRRFISEKTRASMSSITLMNQAFHNHHRCHMHGALSVNLAR